jgi:HSP20 family molecular chaperone IbpA
MKNKNEEIIRNLLNKGKQFIKDAEDVITITEIAKGLEFVDVLKSKAKDVQTKFETDNLKNEENAINNLPIEEFDDKLVINVVLSGLHKNCIFIELENENLSIILDTNLINKKFMKYWSIPNNTLNYDLSSYKNRIIEEKISSVYDNGILNIHIPIIKIENKPKKKIQVL